MGPVSLFLERWVFLAVLTLSGGVSLWGLGKPVRPMGIPEGLLPFPHGLPPEDLQADPVSPL